MQVQVVHEERVCGRDDFHSVRDDSGIGDFINGTTS